MENKRSKNFFLSKNKFVSFAFWKNKEEMFSVFPGFFIEKNIDKGLEIVIDRYVFCLGRKRLEINTGIYSPRNTILNWKDSGLEDFIIWMRKNGNVNFNKNDVDNFLKENPEWKKLITISSCKNYYIKLLLAKAFEDFNSKIVNKEKEKRAEGNLSSAANALLDALADKNEEDSNISPLDRLGDLLNMTEEANASDSKESNHWGGTKHYKK
ncbi:TPA: hypothetical protein NV714_002086 [Escherichia coli]|nr:hypothetical protein [Escherichia coli]